jgi:hypothetical protein
METCRQVGRGLVDKSRTVRRCEKGSLVNAYRTCRQVRQGLVDKYVADLSTSPGPWGGAQGEKSRLWNAYKTCRHVGRGLVDKYRAVRRGLGEKSRFEERPKDLSTSRTVTCRQVSSRGAEPGRERPFGERLGLVDK